MVDKAIYEQVHQLMEAHKENMIQDIDELIFGDEEYTVSQR